MAVAVIAGLNSVNLAVKLVLELVDVGEIMQARIIKRLIDSERIFGPFKIGAEGLNGGVFPVSLDVVFHRRHPVAEEHVDVAALH